MNNDGDPRDHSWSVEEAIADVATLHSLGPPANVRRTLRWCVPTTGAIVLGSTQPESDISRARADEFSLDVVRRRSGGGAVLVEPGDTTWLDVFIPRGDPLWLDDVGRAFHWIGAAWAEWLSAISDKSVEVYQGPLISNEWSKQICFAGLGPGEVLMDGRKVVGISQRRTREGALFQCSIYRSFRTARLVSLLDVVAAEKEAGINALNQSVVAFSYSDLQVRSGVLAVVDQL